MYYTTSCQKDAKWIKLYVAALFLMDTTNTVAVCEFVFDKLVTHFGDVAYLQTAGWAFPLDALTVGSLATMVQLFFAWRVRVISGSNWLTGLIVVVSVASFLTAIGTSVATAIIQEFPKLHKSRPIGGTWLAFSAVCDILITTALVVSLRRFRTGIDRTDGVIARIVRVNMETGLLTAIVATVDFIVLFASPSVLHLGFNIPLGKLYVNSVLATLNWRARMPDDTNVTAFDPTMTGPLEIARPSNTIAFLTPVPTSRRISLNEPPESLELSVEDRGGSSIDKQASTFDLQTSLEAGDHIPYMFRERSRPVPARRDSSVQTESDMSSEGVRVVRDGTERINTWTREG
ncbi:uncharacterized protein STEHIDRAFT_86647 [Stereum hirsutum FP-91666 SS1]|uniref:uncharacterized protein n=1 Tax=Stereum hirsutum (strain FP-91666) TaxID=721885 RepID=UPI0004449559|nr:uncharacterized protein STEHIDRAFT_86647 [Stereum hirsutum FP-91666 SS1]EIM81295.1 hypothetical protein STEHIDRAFT_86647 [Stereum hirsutum FP-91666 SS1]